MTSEPAAGNDPAATLLAVRPDDHVRGPISAPTLVLYGDYECPYTRAAYRTVQIIERRAVLVRFVYRHFPLTAKHPHALPAAAAAESAGRQGRFWEMHDLLFKRQAALSDIDLLGYADELELDTSDFGTSIDPTDVARIDRDVGTGRQLGIQGTPTIFVGGVRQNGYRPDDLLPVIREPADVERGASAVGNAPFTSGSSIASSESDEP